MKILILKCYNKYTSALFFKKCLYLIIDSQNKFLSQILDRAAYHGILCLILVRLKFDFIII